MARKLKTEKMKLTTLISAIVIGMILMLASITVDAQCENDTINPWFVDFQFELTVECDDFTTAMMPITNDNCDTYVEIAMIEDIIPGNCEGEQTIYRIYRAFDDSGNQVVESQIVHVVDETPPAIIVAAGYTVSCNDPIIFDTPTVTDNCSFVSLMSIDYSESNSDCSTVYYRLWTAQDVCGNVSSATQTITMIDLDPPVITGDNYLNLDYGTSIDSVFITATDDCSQVGITYTDMEVSGGNIIRTYTATDVCGNASTFEQIIHVNGNSRVAICHRLGNGNWITLYVAPQAVPAHLAHGDYLGPCNSQTHCVVPMGMYLREGAPGNFRKIVISK